MRRLKVDVDLDSGSVVIKTTLLDFHDVCLAAALNCHDRLKRDRAEENDEGVAYHDGLLRFIQGVELLIRMQRWPHQFEDPIPLIARDVKTRRAEVEQERHERQLLDRIVEEALAEERHRRNRETVHEGP